MGLLTYFLLRILHFIYALYTLIQSFRKRLTGRQPLSLQTPRHRIPNHLAILIVTDHHHTSDATGKCLTDSVVKAVEWCRGIGIKKLTVYEEHGHLLESAQSIRDLLPTFGLESNLSDSEIEYPLTPPPSDYSESRPLSPQHDLHGIFPSVTIHVKETSLRKEANSRRTGVKRRQRHDLPVTRTPRNPLTLCLVSKSSSKAAIAAAARSIAQIELCKPFKTRSSSKDAYHLTVDELDSILENEDGLSSPEFMIVYPFNPPQYKMTPLELHGFPPWHIRLTEIFYVTASKIPLDTHNTSAYRGPAAPTLDETSFREALDEFATAEMRFGK